MSDRLSQSSQRIVFGLLVAVTAVSSAACECASCSCRRADAFTHKQSGPWHVVESPNFQVCSLATRAEALRVARHCECLRTKLEDTWQCADAPWSLRCQVVLHATAVSYRQAVGPGGESTLGSSLASPVRGPVGSRRIDLRTDVDDVLTAALPHELCHLVIADRFRDAPPPLWLDEGIAIQYDTHAKRQLHDRDCQAALAQGTAFPLADLLASDCYPSRARWGAFYGQSASLVNWLLTKQSPARLLEFAKLSAGNDVDRVVQQSYGVDSIDDLYLAWRKGNRAAQPSLHAELPAPSSSPFSLVSQ